MKYFSRVTARDTAELRDAIKKFKERQEEAVPPIAARDEQEEFGRADDKKLGEVSMADNVPHFVKVHGDSL